MSVEQLESPINLAREEAFALGGLQVRPPTRELVVDGQSQKLEPRVMQVLVALARRRGRVVSRDDLIRQCWAGRDVSGDAINRPIYAVRRLAATYGGFCVHTVSRVGYRLDEDGKRSDVAEPPSEPLLAVLAFDNLSGDPEMAYFSDGVSEEILQTVAGGANLKVIGRASSFRFRGAEKAAGKVAAALSATHILDGSVRRSGSRVRISAQLIECDGETTIWSGSYERELLDVFALQDEIATSVAAALEQVFTPQRRGRIDPETYDLYLRARGWGMTGRVIAALEEVTARAPEFAHGWVSLGGWLCPHARFWEPDRHRKEEMFRRAESAGRRALALNPGLGGAHAILADAEPVGAWSRRDEHLMRALDLSPDRPEVLLARGSYLAGIGREREAVKFVERGYALNPLWAPLAWLRGILLWLTNSPEAQRFSRERAFRDPDQPIFANLWALNSVFAEDWTSFAEAEKAAPSGDRDPHRVQRTLSWGRAVRDREAAAADRMVRESEERLAAFGGLPFEDYLFLWKLGRVEAAFDLVARSTYAHRQDRTRDTPSAFQPEVLFFAGAYRGFTDDSRVMQLFAKLGLCDHWLASDRWPDCAEEVPYDFRVEARKFATEGPEPS